jgi:hypothetical protein
VIVSASGDTIVIGDHGKFGITEPIPDGVHALHEMVGDWMSCQVCHELIQEGSINAVTERCIRRFHELYGPDMDMPELSFSAMHHGFVAHRTGEPVPVKE